MICIHADATALKGSYFGDGDGPYHLSNIFCRGAESTLLDCRHSKQSISLNRNCVTPGHDIGVRCEGKCFIIS